MLFALFVCAKKQKKSLHHLNIKKNGCVYALLLLYLGRLLFFICLFPEKNVMRTQWSVMLSLEYYGFPFT